MDRTQTAGHAVIKTLYLSCEAITAYNEGDENISELHLTVWAQKKISIAPVHQEGYHGNG